MNKNKNAMPSEKKDLLLKLSATLSRYGINAYTLDARQLKTYDKMLAAMETLASKYMQIQADLKNHTLNKTAIAKCADISISTLKHDPNATLMINGFAKEHGIIADTHDNPVNEEEISALQRQIAERDGLILSLKRKLEATKQISLDLFAERKCNDELEKEIEFLKIKIKAYYNKLQEIKDSDTGWANRLSSFFKTNESMYS